MALFRSCFVCVVFALCVQLCVKAYPCGDLSIKLKLNDDAQEGFSAAGSEKNELPEYVSQVMAKTSEEAAKQDNNSSTAPKMTAGGINNIYLIGSINATEVIMGQSVMATTTTNGSSTRKPKPAPCPIRQYTSPRPSTTASTTQCTTSRPPTCPTRRTECTTRRTECTTRRTECTTRRTECTTRRTECPTTCPTTATATTTATTTTTTTCPTTQACPKKSRHPEYFEKHGGVPSTQQLVYRVKSQGRTNAESTDKSSHVDCHCSSRINGDSRQYIPSDQTFV